MSLVLRLPRKMHLSRSSSNVPRLPSFLEMLQNLQGLLTFWQGPQSLAPATRNGIWTSKSGSCMWCFSHFDFEMCFAPQRCAFFRHLNFQKWSGAEMFCTFWLGNVLPATTACNFFDIEIWSVFSFFMLANVLRATTVCIFSTSQLPKVVRSWNVLHILTWKCASGHNSVHFFDISTSKSGPELRCFVHFDLETCFAPQRRAIFHLSFGQLAPHPPL